MENLKPEMEEIVKELKVETAYAIHKYNWPKEHARHVYNRSVGNVLSCLFYEFMIIKHLYALNLLLCYFYFR